MSSQSDRASFGEASSEHSNFMRQFRDKNTRQLKNLTSVQFMEVWSHYDKDGKFLLFFCIQAYQIFVV